MFATLCKFGMVSLLVASTPGGTPLQAPGIWAQWGLAGVVVAYVLWHNWQRERRMSEAIEENNRWVRDTLLDALAKNTEVIERVCRCSERRADP